MKKFSRTSWLAALVGALLLFVLPAAQAANTTGADTDLFANVNVMTTGEANILFVVDNAAAGSTTTQGSNYCNIDSSGNVSTATETVNKTLLSGTTLGTIQCALYGALNAVTAGTTNATFNIAIMVFNSNGQKSYDPTTGNYSSDCSGGDGGCLVIPLVGFTTTNKARILSWIKSWSATSNGNTNIKGPTQMANGAIMQEAWAFYKGRTGVSGRTYTAPTIGCGKNYVVFVGNAYDNNMKPGDSTGSHGPKDPLFGDSGTTTENASPAATTAEKTTYSDTVTARYNIGGTTLTCTAAGGSSYTFTSSENTGTYGLNWAKYMYNQHTIKTYSIGLLSSGCKADYPVWLDRLADAGASQFFPTNDYTTLKAAIETVTGQIISVNSVFASVSLPVSTTNRSDYLNQVFIGMFRPDSGYLPRWYGNLKQFQLAVSTNGVDVKLTDANGNQAVNTSTGFITECARSFWTPSSVDSYWANRSSGTCTTIANSAASNYPDGNIVEKGAQAYMLRQVTPSNRTVKTCGTSMSSCSYGSSLINFNTTTLSSLDPGNFYTGFSSTDTAARDNLINFARGENNLAAVTNLQQGDNELSAGSGVMRASVHGDVLHSRPSVINYGTDQSPQVVAYYGANDGMLHAVVGNQSSNFTYGGANVSPGQELWSFMPPEFYSSIRRLYLNTEQIYYTGTNNDSATSKNYGMDGTITSFTGTINNVSKTYLFAGMRRGGRALYAFDVTSPTSPALLWKAGCSSASMSSTDCTANNNDYSGFGQTWAPTRLFYASGYNSGTIPLLLMGGGYDTCEDTDTGTANFNCTSPKGAYVYVLDARDGSIVTSFPTVAPWSGGTPRGVIGDSTFIKDSSTGFAKYAYIADLGGVVYRLDFTGQNKNQWSMTPIAKLGCDRINGTTADGNSCTANRKFMFQPSVVPDTNDTNVNWVLLGSGDREKPVYAHVASRGVSNYFFALQDKPTGDGSSTWLSDENTTCGVGGANVLCLQSLQKIDGSADCQSADVSNIRSGANAGTKKGWYLTLAATEQVVTSAVTQLGVTSFSTHTPATAANTCSNNLGYTRVYNRKYQTACSNSGTLWDHVAGDGLPPSPVAGTVIINGQEIPFCIGCSKDSPLEAKKATQGSSVSRARNRVYWFLEKN